MLKSFPSTWPSSPKASRAASTYGVAKAVSPPHSNPMRGTLLACCAHIAGGASRVTLAPTSTPLRLIIGSPRPPAPATSAGSSRRRLEIDRQLELHRLLHWSRQAWHLLSVVDGRLERPARGLSFRKAARAT